MLQRAKIILSNFHRIASARWNAHMNNAETVDVFMAECNITAQGRSLYCIGECKARESVRMKMSIDRLASGRRYNLTTKLSKIYTRIRNMRYAASLRRERGGFGLRHCASSWLAIRYSKKALLKSNNHDSDFFSNKSFTCSTLSSEVSNTFHLSSFQITVQSLTSVPSTTTTSLS